MTYFRRDSWIQDVQGNALAGAHLWVCYQRTGRPVEVFKTRPPEPLAQIFRDAQGMELEEMQPREADGTGHFVYYAATGFYTEVYFFQGRLYRVLRDQAIGILGATIATGFSTAALTSANVLGQPQPAQLVLIHTFAFQSTFPANFNNPSSFATAGTAATNLAVYVITLNGINVGSVTFSPAGGRVFETLGFVADPGDRLEMKAPEPGDVTLSDVAISLVYTRTSTTDILGATGAITSENVFGQPQPGQLVLIHTFAFQASFPANFNNPRSYATAGSPAMNPAVYVVALNDVDVGTVTFAATGSALFQTAGFSVQPGDRVTITAPDPMDETLIDVAITLAYTRLT